MRIKAELIDGGRKIKLLEHIIVNTRVLKCTVPAGFECDYASVPRPFWALMPPMGNRYTAAAILHDYMYRTHKVLAAETPGVPRFSCSVNKYTADHIFKEVMEAAGVRKWRVLVMYWAVRLFGARAWADGFPEK